MTSLTAFVYAVGALVCHQIPERSFYYAGSQFPVCARCTGLYVGALAGLVMWMSQRSRLLSLSNARRALLVAALPTVITVATATLGLWDPANLVRALFAAPLGLTTAFVVAAGLAGQLR